MADSVLATMFVCAHLDTKEPCVKMVGLAILLTRQKIGTNYIKNGESLLRKWYRKNGTHKRQILLILETLLWHRDHLS